jgi:Cupin-like domain
MGHMIQCLDSPSKDEMYDKSNAYTEPIVIKGGVKKWKAISTWSIDTLRAKFGSLLIQVAWASDGVFRGDPVDGFANTRRIRFDRFIDVVAGRTISNRGGKYYLAQHSLSPDGDMASLLQDIEEPDCFEKSLLQVTNLWLGSTGNISPLHFDRSNNFLCQVSGTKRLILFDPNQSDRLYPFPETSRIPHLAQIDIDNPDFDKFPKSKYAASIEATVNAGDMIFIPRYWWHQVYSVSTSISVNFWYKPLTPLAES